MAGEKLPLPFIRVHMPDGTPVRCPNGDGMVDLVLEFDFDEHGRAFPKAVKHMACGATAVVGVNLEAPPAPIQPEIPEEMPPPFPQPAAPEAPADGA